MGNWFKGIKSEFTRPLTPIVLADFPSVHADREVAASELDRLAPPGKIHWYEEGAYPPHLCVCPSHLIVPADKVRVVHDWSNWQYPRNAGLVNPPVEYGATDGFLELLAPGAFMGGIDLLDCFLRWLVSPSCRR